MLLKQYALLEAFAQQDQLQKLNALQEPFLISLVKLNRAIVYHAQLESSVVTEVKQHQTKIAQLAFIAQKTQLLALLRATNAKKVTIAPKV